MEVFRRLLEVLPGGWQYPHICRARITYQGESFASGRLSSHHRVAVSAPRSLVQEQPVGS